MVLKNPHLDTSDTKIGLNTKVTDIQALKKDFGPNFGVFGPIFVSGVSKWGFMKLRSWLESSKIRKS